MSSSRQASLDPEAAPIPPRHRAAASLDDAARQGAACSAGAASSRDGASSRDVAASQGDAGSAAHVDADLLAAVDRLVAVPVDELDEDAIRRQLGTVERVRRRLDARRCRLADTLADRQATRAGEAAKAQGRDDIRARERARQDVGRELAQAHRWGPSETKRALGVGSQMREPGPAQAAFDAGALPARHAELLADTLKCLTDPADRDLAQRQLLAAAAEQDPVAFGRTCRRLLAELDQAAAQRAETRRHGRRRLAIAPTDDGMLAISGVLAGLDAETVATAIDAFRHPDVPGQHRTAEQRTADALVELARAALRAGEASEQHGVRPHVTVTIDWDTIRDGAGVAEAAWLGPLPYSEVRRLLADASVARLLVDAKRVPLEAGEAVRSVPAGLWRAVVARDRGCVAEGCDIPAGWTDVMHLERPYRFDGRLSPRTAALGCRHHHRLYDHHGWRIDWVDGRPVLRPPP
jgi:hypothetical protein